MTIIVTLYNLTVIVTITDNNCKKKYNMTIIVN